VHTSANGIWLLARLWAHDTYNRGLFRYKQEPLWGASLNSVDWLEITHLRLELGRANQAKWPESVR
jgi:hypothetical protein